MKNFDFYEIMNYPIPTQQEFFSTEKESELPEIQEGFSREEKNPYRGEYYSTITKYQKIFKHLPYIKAIYLGNSLSFNSISEHSDIDLCIITKRGAIRRARLITLFVFWILGIKRSATNKKKKFCLSFYIDEDHQNLYNISLAQVDIYLAYRIAHLVPLYLEEKEKNKKNENMREANSWINSILPNIPQQQTIFLDFETSNGSSKIKKRIENSIRGIAGTVSEYLIKTIRVPILMYKTNKNPKNKQRIIISDTMLKFHEDKRQKIHLLYKTKSTSTKNNG